jgi:hypothetical protein
MLIKRPVFKPAFLFCLIRQNQPLFLMGIFEELFSQKFCDRPGPAGPDGPAVNLDYPDDLGRGAVMVRRRSRL